MERKAMMFFLFPMLLLAATHAAASDADPKGDADGRKFAGLKFGIGISLTVNGGEPSVESASVVNGIVRVDKERTSKARILLESHYFFRKEAKSWGYGPFIGVLPGSSQTIDALGGGLMVGFRRNENTSDSFNLGVGYMWDSSVRSLGDGIERNKPLPAGETAIRYRDTDGNGVVLIFSYSF